LKLPALFAHRGDSAEAPENTLAAFRLAIHSGAEGVEFDVQASRDAVPVVIHDRTLERTTDGAGLVGEHTLAELKALEAGAWKAPAFAGERIPTLEEALNLLRGSALALNIELKTSEMFYPGLAEAVARIVREMGLAGRTILSSFNHHSLLEAARSAPEIPRAALLDAHLIEPWRYVLAQGFQALHVERHACTAELARGCAQAGIPLRAYIINDEGEFRRLAALGVDAVFTDHPRRLAQVRARMR
jgi:glycerophosphoryl diester phosphodiesterase